MHISKEILSFARLWFSSISGSSFLNISICWRLFKSYIYLYNHNPLFRNKKMRDWFTRLKIYHCSKISMNSQFHFPNRIHYPKTFLPLICDWKLIIKFIHLNFIKFHTFFPRLCFLDFWNKFPSPVQSWNPFNLADLSNGRNNIVSHLNVGERSMDMARNRDQNLTRRWRRFSQWTLERNSM